MTLFSHTGLPAQQRGCLERQAINDLQDHSPTLLINKNLMHSPTRTPAMTEGWGAPSRK
jgi:hypothetical protein